MKLPVRMLRVVRFCRRASFKIEAKTEAPIERLAHLLARQAADAHVRRKCSNCSMAVTRLRLSEMLRRCNLFQYLFPLTDECLSREDQGFPRTLERVRSPRHRRARV